MENSLDIKFLKWFLCSCQNVAHYQNCYLSRPDTIQYETYTQTNNYKWSTKKIALKTAINNQLYSSFTLIVHQQQMRNIYCVFLYFQQLRSKWKRRIFSNGSKNLFKIRLAGKYKSWYSDTNELPRDFPFSDLRYWSVFFFFDFRLTKI